MGNNVRPSRFQNGVRERFGLQRVRTLKGAIMADRRSLIDTLRSTSAILLAVRQSIFDNGHIQAMIEIDTLLAVAKTETDRRISIAISRTTGLSKT